MHLLYYTTHVKQNYFTLVRRMDIVDNIRINKLFDIYGQLLTDRQQVIMSAYFYDNLTLSEIGDNLSISRQAVKDSISVCIKALENFEKCLHVVENETDIISKLESLKDCPKDKLAGRIDQIINELRR